MSPRTTSHRSTRSLRSRLRPPSAVRRPSLYLAAAAAGAVLLGTAAPGEPTASAEPAASVSVAEQLGISAEAGVSIEEQIAPLQQMAASRSERESEQLHAAKAQRAADEAAAEKARKAAAEKARKEAARKAAAEEAAREEAERRAAEKEAAREAEAAEAAEAAPAAPAAAAPSGSYQDYALSKLGGDASEFSCLEALWGKESGWNPNAQNPTSSAYGIPQFLDSTWASTGIAKTSDGYRQIDAGLIYIENRYGSPCGAWSHSQSTGWY